MSRPQVATVEMFGLPRHAALMILMNGALMKSAAAHHPMRKFVLESLA